MDLVYWLRQRTDIIRLFYEKSRVPFEQIKRDIEDGVRPWEPPPFDPDTDDGEPAFLPEWMQAEQTRELVGMLAVSLLSDTLSLYFQNMQRELGVEFISADQKRKLFKLGRVEAYRRMLQEVMGKMFSECPVRFDVIEQVILARNDFAHSKNFISFETTHGKTTLEKHPNPFFRRTEDADSLHRFGGPDIEVSREKLFEAIDEVEKLAAWVYANEDAVRAWRRKQP